MKQLPKQSSSTSIWALQQQENEGTRNTAHNLNITQCLGKCKGIHLAPEIQKSRGSMGGGRNFHIQCC